MTLDQLAPALVAAQAQFPVIPKNAVNPHLRNKYADLESVISSVRGPLGREGLSLMQLVSTEPIGDIYLRDIYNKQSGKTEQKRARCVDVVITTVLQHVSGQQVSTETRLSVDNGFDPHAVGSAITYGRRYALSAMLCLATGEGEDDGNAARQEQERPKQAAKPKRLEAIAPLLKAAGAKSSEDARALLEESGLRCAEDDYRVNSEGRVMWDSMTDEVFASLCRWLSSRTSAPEPTTPEPAPTQHDEEKPGHEFFLRGSAEEAQRHLRTVCIQMGAKSAKAALGLLATWGVPVKSTEDGKVDWASIDLEGLKNVPPHIWRGEVANAK